MSRKKKMTARQRARAARKAKNTQTIIIAAVVVVALVIIWIIAVAGAPASQANPTPAAQVPAAAVPTPSYKQYSAPPPMTVDTSKEYYATVKLAKGGEFVIQLFPDKAPVTVNNFIFLAREGYYDGTTFHRVLDGFMAQGGDPSGTGAGGPGYAFQNEDSDLTFDKPGVVAMANAGRDTNGSQFFITFVPTPQLNGGYTIFGQVIEGMDVVNGITRRDPDLNPNFTGDVIESITITEQ